MVKKGLLVVSFGTTYRESRIRSIEAIEKAAESAFLEFRLYRAWTSTIIRKILSQRDGYEVDDVPRALEKMKQDGIEEVKVLSTHILSGIEYGMLKEAIAAREGDFRSLFLSAPLLSEKEDYRRAVSVLEKEVLSDIADAFGIRLKEDKRAALVLMGHGTSHPSHASYGILQDTIEEMGWNNIHVAVMDGAPSFEALLPELEKKGYKTLVFAPFMVVAGDHAHNDMAGKEDSWASLGREKGWATFCLMKGLGEYYGIREMFLSHLTGEKSGE